MHSSAWFCAAGGGLAAYLLGAVPFGYLIARARGVDIRAVGSGNIGATNVLRCVGKPWGALTFLCDAAKGFIPPFWFAPLAAAAGDVPSVPALRVACAVLAVAGHNWPVFMGFRGGKGVATSVGALLGIAPAAAGAGFGVWLAVFLPSGYVSLASLAAAVLIPVFAWITRGEGGSLVPAALTVLGLFIVWRHASNIRRLLSGTEHRFDFRRKGRGAPAPAPPPAAGNGGAR